MEKLRVLDLFSGIGGFSLGLERAGMQTVAFCEIDPYCRAVLAKHWPHVPCAEDITTREFIEGEADVICGGFPCQDISFAGSGAGLAGERSGLWRELLRAIRVVRPRYAIVENVAALLGRGLGVVLGDLASIGYDAEWHCIPASAVGAPHRRDRVWIVADSELTGLEGTARRRFSGTGRETIQPPRFSEAMAVAIGSGQSRQGQSLNASNQAAHRERQASDAVHVGIGSIWATEPDVGRVANGIPNRMERLSALGNAVVPQIPEMIGKAVLEAM